MERSL
jgi:hypothetical protein